MAEVGAGKRARTKSWVSEEGVTFDNTTVEKILRGKKPGTFTISPEASVLDALRVMAERNVGALIVVEGGDVRGVISERDYARKVILIGKSSRETQVREIMSAPAVTVGPGATVSECMELMTGSFVRHLPVLEGDDLIGCLSIGDVVKAVISDQQRLIGQFTAYVSGTYPA